MNKTARKEVCAEGGQDDAVRHFCLEAHPYYLNCIKLWVPPCERMALAPPPVCEAVPHYIYLLESGLLEEAHQLASTLFSFLEKIKLDDLSYALQSLYALYKEDKDSALLLAQKAVSLQPGCAAYHYLCGTAAAQKRDVDSCVVYCKQALSLDPHHALAAAALAIIYTLDRKWEDALAAARRAKRYLAFTFHLVDLCLLEACWRLEVRNESLFDLTPLEEEGGADAFCLPPVLWPQEFHKKPFFFIYGDSLYCRDHILPMLCSLIAVGAKDYPVHIHLADIDAEEQTRLIRFIEKHQLAVTLSFEKTGSLGVFYGRIYHASVRFCRFAQILGLTRQPVYMLDADSLFHRHPQELNVFYRDDIDIALQFAPKNPLWEICTGAGILAYPTRKAASYLSLVSRFIGANLATGKGRWFLDQIALGLSYEKRQKETRFGPLSQSITADQTFSEESVIWTVGLEKTLDDKYNQYKTMLLKKFSQR